tara:strand:+ start:508 stop:2304 length:1797 start_codon:yes stop_codon:yes gene_type:complete
MAKVVGDIAVQVGADVSKLQDGMRKGGRSVKNFEAKSAKMAKNFAKVGVAVTAAAVGIAASVFKMAQSSGQAAADIKNLSNVAGVGVESFQRLAAGARTVGLEQEKLADIFKDVNDKFGDFMATGAGPLADFFENIAPAVGVTAEQFAKLSGPDALQLYVTSLERAGVSQQQMTFYMEALASDATALVPLLSRGGAAMNAYGDEAQRAGRIMSKDMVAAGVELDNKLKDITDELQTKAKIAVIEYSDEILAAADFITDTLIPAIGEFIGWISGFVDSMAPAIKTLGDFIGLLQTATGLGNEGAPATLGAGEAERWKRDDFSGFDDSSTDVSNTGAWPLDEDGNLIGLDTPTLNPPIVIKKPVTKKPKAARSGGGGGGGGGGGASITREDLEAMQELFAEEAELLDMQYEANLEKLREFRESKMGTEEEFNALEADIKKKHEEDMLALERAAQQQRLQSFSGALGDLSSLMQSENKKLFKIGQAAAIAEAVVSGYGAAVSAWEKGMKVGGPTVAYAFAGASLLKTASLISSISSASSSGAGGGVGGGAIAAGGGAAAPQQRRLAEFRVEGSNVQGLGSLVDSINEALDQGFEINLQYAE